MFARARFVSGPDGATVIDVALYFGHPEVDLALVDVFSPVQPELLSAYAQLAPVNPGFAGRRELWRLHEYLGGDRGRRRRRLRVGVPVTPGGSPCGSTRDLDNSKKRRRRESRPALARQESSRAKPGNRVASATAQNATAPDGCRRSGQG
jgi:hypothetical protein